MDRLRTESGSPQGILLVGHGTRDLAGVSEFHATVRQVADMLPHIPVEACFLEIAEPAIADGLATLARRGVREIIVAPILLFAAGHAKRDIPQAVADAAVQWPGLKITRYVPPLECHPLIVELSAQRYREAIESRDSLLHPQAGTRPAGALDSETLLLFVGRGSRDADASAQMYKLAELRNQLTRVAKVEVCFVAMAEPSLDAALARVAELQTFHRIVVQPHLLFAGELQNEIRQKVATAARTRPDVDWVITEGLGPDPLLAQAIAGLITGSAQHALPAVGIA